MWEPLSDVELALAFASMNEALDCVPDGRFAEFTFDRESGNWGEPRLAGP
jgi:hypothetical protein